MQTVCKFKHCLPQTLLGMLGCREVTVAINIISVCSCFVCLHNFQFVKTLLKKRIWESKDLPHRMLWYDVQGKLGSGIFLTKTESGTKTVTKVESENRIQTDWKHYTVTLTSIEQDVVIHYSRGTWIKTNRQCLLSMVQNRDKDKRMDRRELLPVIKWWNNIQLHRIARRIT